MAEKKQLNVNTNGVAFFNSDEGYKVNSTLRTGYWNDKCQLAIYPKLENPSEGRIFDYDNQMAAFLNVGDVGNLLGLLDEVVDSEKENVRKAIPTSKGMVEFGTSNAELGIDTPYLNICETDEDRKVTKSLLYQFKPTIVIDSYNYETGEYEIERNKFGEVEQFMAAMEASQTAMSNAFAHTVAEKDKYAKEKLTNNIIKVMDKLGIPVEYTGKKSGGNYNRWDTAKVATSNKNLPEEHSSDIDSEDIYG